MVGINIILRCGEKYVKFAWEFSSKPGREHLDFLHLKKIEWTQKTKNIVCIEVLCILEKYWCEVRVGVSDFLTFKNI
jgi:hypothetical protein